jgi:hypothetical protein
LRRFDAHQNKTFQKKDNEAATFGYPRVRSFWNSGSEDLWLSATGAVMNGG